MIYHLLFSLGLNVTVHHFNDIFDVEKYDLVVLDPGPGDPGNNKDERIIHLNQLIDKLIKIRRPFLAIYLSHQILCLKPGLAVLLKKNPNQGAQKQINSFGAKENVGFYNSYAGFTMADNIYSREIGVIDINKTPLTMESMLCTANIFHQCNIILSRFYQSMVYLF